MLTDQAVITLNKKILNGLIGGPIKESRTYRTEEGEAIMSNELLSVIVAENDLSKYTKVIPTDQAHGVYPYLDITGSVLSEHEEIVESEIVPNVNMIDINYTIKTYRGSLPISIELVEDIADSGVDYGEELGAIAKQIDVNTKNKELIEVMKEATAKTTVDEKELASIINKDLSSSFNIKLFLSASMYNSLDEKGMIEYIKDYPTFKGKEVIKIDDSLMGTGKGFIGDLKHYVHLFDRKYITLKEANHTDFTRPITVVTRFDVAKANESAGYYITYTG